MRDNQQTGIAPQHRRTEPPHREQAGKKAFGVRGKTLNHSARVARDLLGASHQPLHFDVGVGKVLRHFVVDAIQSTRPLGEPLHPKLERSHGQTSRTLGCAQERIHPRVAVERAVQHQSRPYLEHEQRPYLLTPVVHAGEVLRQHAAHELWTNPPSIKKRSIVERRPHVGRELSAKPPRRRHDEPALAPIHHELWDESRGDLL